MSGTGALCQLPLRLGVVDSSGLSAADHARVCADLLAAVRSVPIARATLVRDGSNYTITAWRAQSGLESSLGPFPLNVTTAYIAADIAYTDALGNQQSLAATHAIATPASSGFAGTPRAYLTSSSAVRYVAIDLATDGDAVTVTIYGTCTERAKQIQDYGGASDKRDSAAERVPYAWTALEMLRGARGSAYSLEVGGLVHVENLALARAHAMNWRNAERAQTNANPETAWEKAEEWRVALGVRPRPDDTPADVRIRCGAKFNAAQGPRQQVNDDAIRKVLGSLYVKTWREYGDDLANPPTVTKWPGVDDGLSDYDLGGGPWYSERAHLMVEVTQPSDVGLSEFTDKMNQLYELLDRQLPAYVTFDWGVNVEGGFVLDESQLDFGAISRIGT